MVTSGTASNFIFNAQSIKYTQAQNPPPPPTHTRTHTNTPPPTHTHTNPTHIQAHLVFQSAYIKILIKSEYLTKPNGPGILLYLGNKVKRQKVER